MGLTKSTWKSCLLIFTTWCPAFAPALTYESSMSVILTIQWHLQALQAVKQQMTMVVPPSLSVTKSEPISKMTSMPVTSILGFTITPGISNKTKGGSIQDPGSQHHCHNTINIFLYSHRLFGFMVFQVDVGPEQIRRFDLTHPNAKIARFSPGDMSKKLHTIARHGLLKATIAKLP